MKRLLIVGYDPGTSAALAIIDTKGDILFLKSKRGLKRSEINDEITQRGKPIIIAGDRSPLPKNVEKLASNFSCKTYHPKNSLTTLEKIELVKDYEDKLKGDHERDALASALKAFQFYSKLFKRTEATLSSVGMIEFYDRVIEMVITGKVENINEAINKILTKIEIKPKIKERKVETTVSMDTVIKLHERIRILERDIEILKKHNEGLKKKLMEREERHYEKVTKTGDVLHLKRLRDNINRLKDELSKKESLINLLKNHRKLEVEGYMPIIEIREISSQKVKDLDEMFDLENRVLFVKNPDNAQILDDYKIRALISSVKPKESILEKVNFPIINEKDISITKVKNITVVKIEEFEEEVKKARKSGFVTWLEGHKKRKF